MYKGPLDFVRQDGDNYLNNLTAVLKTFPMLLVSVTNFCQLRTIFANQMEKIILTMTEFWTNLLKINADLGEEDLESIMLIPIVKQLKMP